MIWVYDKNTILGLRKLVPFPWSACPAACNGQCLHLLRQHVYYGSNPHTILVLVPKAASQKNLGMLCEFLWWRQWCGLSVWENRISQGLQGVPQIPNIWSQNLAELVTETAMNDTFLVGLLPSTTATPLDTERGWALLFTFAMIPPLGEGPGFFLEPI